MYTVEIWPPFAVKIPSLDPGMLAKKQGLGKL